MPQPFVAFHKMCIRSHEKVLENTEEEINNLVDKFYKQGLSVEEKHQLSSNIVHRAIVKRSMKSHKKQIAKQIS